MKIDIECFICFSQQARNNRQNSGVPAPPPPPPPTTEPPPLDPDYEVIEFPQQQYSNTPSAPKVGKSAMTGAHFRNERTRVLNANNLKLCAACDQSIECLTVTIIITLPSNYSHELINFQILCTKIVEIK